MKIKVYAKADRFRRAGIVFGRGVVELDTRTLTPEQFDAIENEPMLVVETGETGKPVAESKAPKAKAPKGKGTKTKGNSK